MSDAVQYAVCLSCGATLLIFGRIWLDWWMAAPGMLLIGLAVLTPNVEAMAVWWATRNEEEKDESAE